MCEQTDIQTYIHAHSNTSHRYQWRSNNTSGYTSQVRPTSCSSTNDPPRLRCFDVFVGHSHQSFEDPSHSHPFDWGRISMRGTPCLLGDPAVKENVRTNVLVHSWSSFCIRSVWLCIVDWCCRCGVSWIRLMSCGGGWPTTAGGWRRWKCRELCRNRLSGNSTNSWFVVCLFFLVITAFLLLM